MFANRDLVLRPEHCYISGILCLPSVWSPINVEALQGISVSILWRPIRGNRRRRSERVTSRILAQGYMWKRGRWLFCVYWEPGIRTPTLVVKNLDKLKEKVLEELDEEAKTR